jgi:pimeloyl-ACP methyl ester carboxylesterase
MTVDNTTEFLAQPVQFVPLANARIAYRKFGSGPALILLHGFPFSSLTYRHLVPHLQQHFTCYAVDTPGAGVSAWSDHYDFDFRSQSQSLRRFVDAIAVTSYSILGHDSGATLGRLLTLSDPGRVERLILINTEIPGHRPPWIPLYTAVGRVVWSTEFLRVLFRSRRYLRSRAAFGPVFFDRRLLDGDFEDCFLTPVLRNRAYREGLRRYLRGFDWTIVDDFRYAHSAIDAPVLMIWGADDPTFPVERAREMAFQFNPTARLTVIDNAKLLVHEERPDQVAAAITQFLYAGS